MTRQQRSREINQALRSFYNRPVAKVSLELILSFCLIVFLGLAAIKPTLTTMSDLTKEIEEKEALAISLDKKIAALTTAQQQLETLGQQLAYLDDALPSNPAVVTNMKILEKAVTDSGVLMLSASASEIPETTNEEAFDATTAQSLGRNQIPITLTIAGEYQDIRGFVEALQNNRRAIIIDTVSFSTENTNTSTLLKASVTTVFPYIGPATE